MHQIAFGKQSYTYCNYDIILWVCYFYINYIINITSKTINNKQQRESEYAYFCDNMNIITYKGDLGYRQRLILWSKIN